MTVKSRLVNENVVSRRVLELLVVNSDEVTLVKVSAPGAKVSISERSGGMVLGGALRHTPRCSMFTRSFCTCLK